MKFLIAILAVAAMTLATALPAEAVCHGGRRVQGFGGVQVQVGRRGFFRPRNTTVFVAPAGFVNGGYGGVQSYGFRAFSTGGAYCGF